MVEVRSLILAAEATAVAVFPAVSCPPAFRGALGGEEVALVASGSVPGIVGCYLSALYALEHVGNDCDVDANNT